ncbi:hypothetical protein UlMin_009024 [Ulmus minor]
MAWRFRPKEGKTTAFYNLLFEKPLKKEEANALPVVGEVVNDTLPVVESKGSFSHGIYLIYVGGGDRCKNMNNTCGYLNRTLVMDLSIYLSSIYTKSNQDDEGKDFRFYFDFEHLRESTFVLDQIQFWADWNEWQKKDRLNLHLVEDLKATPMKLAYVKDALIIGEKARNKDLWPKLDRDTSPDALNLYIATNEPNKSFFDPLKEKYSTHFLDKYKDLWDENIEWYSEMTKLNNGDPVEFDGYMRVSVDIKVFLRVKKQLETFNDLTRDNL